MKIINKILKIEQFQTYLDNIKVYPWSRKIDKIILHHTSSPLESWQNSGSMLHYWNLYRSRGWKAGPHIFIANNGIWLFTPITKKGRCSSPEANKNSIHIEVVGRYYTEYPNRNMTIMTMSVIHKLVDKFPIKVITNHASFEKYTNCTPILDGNWVKRCFQKYKNLIQ